MIAFVKGRIAGIVGDVVVLDTGSIGVSLQCTASALPHLHVGSTAEIPAVLVVREESLTLFGFADLDERAVFEVLQTVSGVGPKVALAILSTLGTATLRRAIANSDLATLTKVSGVGKKGAERLIIELRDKLTPLAGDTPATRVSVASGWQAQVRSGLMGLGWTPRDADAAIAYVESDPSFSEVVAAQDVPTLLRAALRGLDRA